MEKYLIPARNIYPSPSRFTAVVFLAFINSEKIINIEKYLILSQAHNIHPPPGVFIVTFLAFSNFALGENY